MTTVSITLLTCNAGPLLRRLLTAVQSQQTLHTVELVAVDSGSTDATRDTLREFGARVEAIPPESFSFGPSRDAVFSMTSGSIIVSLSQDAIPAHPHWLENLIAPLDNAGASTGRSIADPDRTCPQFVWERNGHFYFTREMRTFRERYGRGLSNANAAYRRDVWERLRFGDQPIGEDFAIQTRMHAAGIALAFPEDAPVLHHHDYTVETLYKRCRNEGFGLRRLGCPYRAADAVADLIRPRILGAWSRALLKGQLRTPAALAFPIIRPLAVYAGSRFGAEYLR